MKKLFRQVFCIILTVMLALSCACPAFADDVWYCPQCGRKCTGNYCPKDGTAKPADLDDNTSTGSTARLTELKSATIGDIVSFGSYEQDGNKSNGKENIEWIVMDATDHALMLVSRYVLDARTFNSQWKYTWENSTIRTWLNNDFYKAAFSSSEKDMIRTTTVTEDWSSDYYEARSTTKDKVFLLSVPEAIYLCGQVTSGKAEATVSCSAGYTTDSKGYASWWTRSPANGVPTSASNYQETSAACVNPDGTIDYNAGCDVQCPCGVRPAIWVSVNNSSTVCAPDGYIWDITTYVTVIDSSNYSTRYNSGYTNSDGTHCKPSATQYYAVYNVSTGADGYVYFTFSPDSSEVYHTLPINYYTYRPGEGSSH